MKTRTFLTCSGSAMTAFMLMGGSAFGQCDMTVPPGAYEENDAGICGGDPASDPNYGCAIGDANVQDLGTLGAGMHYLHGFVGSNDGGATNDEDWYRFTTANPAFVTLTLSSNNATTGGPIYELAMIWGPGACDTAAPGGFYGFAECNAALPTEIWEAGVYNIDTFVYAAVGVQDCTSEYIVSINIVEGQFDSCGDPAGGDCFEVTATPGCSNWSCCEQVCEQDSICCDDGWDDACVEIAMATCNYVNCDTTEFVLGDNAIDTTTMGGNNLDLTGICDPGIYGDDVIYNTQFGTFIPDEDGNYEISTCSQADFDTRLAIGDNGCDPTGTITCLDDTDGCAGFTTIINADLMAGIEYTIGCGGYSAGDMGTGTLTISLGGGGGGGCDDYTNACDSPEVIADDGGTYTVTTSSACAVPMVDYEGYCDMGPAGDDAAHYPYFLSFTPDTTGDWTISTCNQAQFDTRLAIQMDCDASSVVTCLDDTDGCAGYSTTITAALDAGTTYLLVVGGYGGASGTTDVTIDMGGGGGGCDGYDNNCDNPEVLPGDGEYDFDTTCAMAAGDRNYDTTGVCDPGTFGDDICHNTYYYEVTMTSAGTLIVSTCNLTGWDTRLIVADSCDVNTTLACNDDGDDCANYTSHLEVALDAGDYLVGVGGYAAGNSGVGVISISGAGGGGGDPFGTCCIGTVCSVTTEAACLTEGGTYGGDDTTCGADTCGTPCPADFNGDGAVDGGDLTILLGAWNTAAADLNGDGNTDGGDLTILLGAWGPCS